MFWDGICTLIFYGEFNKATFTTCEKSASNSAVSQANHRGKFLPPLGLKGQSEEESCMEEGCPMWAGDL